MRRRDVLAGGLASLLLPGLLRPGTAQGANAQDRCFLFLYAEGGWDPAVPLTPLFDIPGAWVEEGARLESGGGGLPYLDHFSRPALGEFFRRHGAELALLHGMEVPSISHESCLRLLLTGQSQALDADWPTQIAGSPQEAAHAPPGHRRPRLCRGDERARGAPGQRRTAALALGGPPERRRGQRQGGSTDPGPHRRLCGPAQRGARGPTRVPLRARPGPLGQRLGLAELLQSQAQGLTLGQGRPGCTRDYETDFETLFACFEAGLSRCGMIRHKGWCDQGWDTHQLHERQGINWEDLGEVLLDLMAVRDRFPSVKERLVVVVASEMGRHPRLNNWGGKDHWTWTSAMLFGDGVRPGVVGALDALGQGRGWIWPPAAAARCACNPNTWGTPC